MDLSVWAWSFRTAASEQPSAVGYALVRRKQRDVAGLIGKAQHQHFRHELADLPRRKIDDGGDLPADQRGDLVILRDLRAGAPGADAAAEIDGQLQRGLARLGKQLGADDGADADVDREEPVEAYLRRGGCRGVMD